ncbi:MAG: efflux RND transporter periplasmic adaptor subunit [Cellvibrionaceae bacterium]
MPSLFASLRPARLFIAMMPLVLIACSEEAPQQKAPPPAVSVIEVGTQQVGEYGEFVARTEAFKTVDLRARVEGSITKRLFTEGLSVEKDQLLFEIDRENYEAAEQEADANLKSAQAEKLRTERDYQRGLELRPNGYISQSDLDTLASNSAKARASVKAAEAALKNAQANLGYTRIYAPFAGEIGTVRYNVGNLVGPNSEPLATLLKDDPIYANIQIDESSYITHLQEFSNEHGEVSVHKKPPEDAVSITLILPNGTTHDHPGTINYAGIEVNASTGTVNLRAQFPNPRGIVRPGLYGTLILESQDKVTQPVIPQYAVQEGQQGKFVLIVDANNTVKSRSIQVGRRLGPLWVVTSGLNEGDKIIVEGLQKVRAGAAVTPVIKYLEKSTGSLKTQAENAEAISPAETFSPAEAPDSAKAADTTTDA